MNMQVSLSFDPMDEAQVEKAAAVIAGISGGAPVMNITNTSEVTTTIETPDTTEEEPAETAKERTARLRKEKAALKKLDDAKAAEEAEEAEKNKPTASRDDIRKALKDYAALEGKDAAIQILKDHGASSISDLAEDQFDLVVAACG